MASEPPELNDLMDYGDSIKNKTNINFHKYSKSKQPNIFLFNFAFF